MEKQEFNESSRRAALCALGMLDTPAEPRFDHLTALAAAAFGVPIALVSLVDSERQWFKSRHGLAVSETPRSMAFCSYAIEGAGNFIVEDTLLDARFADNALVTGRPHVRFYAGHPVRSSDGHAVGTLCIIDTVPRSLNEQQGAMLAALAGLVESELNRDSQLAARLQTESAQQQLHAALEARVSERTRALEEKNEALNREIRQRVDVEASLRRSEERVRSVLATLEEKQELLDAVLDTVDVAVIACDSAGQLSFFNHAAVEFHGQPPAQVTSAELAVRYDLFHADGLTPLEAHEIPLLRALGGHSVKAMRMVIAPNGLPRRTVLASGRVLQSRSGERLGAVVVMHDITELNVSQEKLRNSEQMLRSIAENLPTLIGQVDRDGRFVYLNGRSLNFYGRPAEQLLGQPVREAYSEADYAKIAGHIGHAAGGRRISFESDIVVGARQFHYHAAFVPQFDERGRPDGFFAMAFDITARRLSEIAQRESEERLRTITDNVPVLIAYLDSDLRFQFANAMYKDWLGMPSAAMIGRTVREVFGDAYFEERAPSLARALSGHMSSVEVKVVRKGHERILNTTYMPQHRDGKVAGVYVLATDATAARLHERKLLALANADPLTNLPNRRMYEFHLAKALALSKRQRKRLALMYLDLDDFKRINDTHGHGAGDAVLVEFGKRVGATLRESDLLARLAGDEFTVVLEAVDSLANCETIASKIQQALQPAFLFDGRSLHISASIGIALSESGTTMASLSAQADEALYSAKRKGKNRYAVMAAAGAAPAA